MPDGTILFANSQALFKINGTPRAAGPVAPYIAQSENPKSSKPHEFWGDNDDRPTLLTRTIAEDTILAPGMEFKTSMQYGGGIAHGEVRINEKGEEYYFGLRDYGPEDGKGKSLGNGFMQFARANHLDLQAWTALHDLNTFGIAFIQLTLNTTRDRIVGFNTQHTRARRCRLSKQLRKGEPAKLFINADWGTPEYNEKKTKTLELAPSFDPVSWIQDRIRASKSFSTFAIAIRIPDTGNMFYPSVAWSSVRSSGWNDINRSLATYKKCLLENQMTIKYHIEIHHDFWKTQFGDSWEALTFAEKKDKKQQWLKGFTDFMKGAKGTGNTLLSERIQNKYGAGETTKMIEVHPIDDKFRKDGMHIEDSREAVLHHMSALGLHPELQGSVPSNSMVNGSGSSARVAFNQRVSMAKPIQDFVLHPLGVVRDFNNWSPKMIFRFRNSLITTLDTGASATKPTPNT